MVWTLWGQNLAEAEKALLGPALVGICDSLLGNVHSDIIPNPLSLPLAKITTLATAGIENGNLHSIWTVSLCLVGVV